GARKHRDFEHKVHEHPLGKGGEACPDPMLLFTRAETGRTTSRIRAKVGRLGSAVDKASPRLSNDVSVLRHTRSRSASSAGHVRVRRGRREFESDRCGREALALLALLKEDFACSVRQLSG